MLVRIRLRHCSVAGVTFVPLGVRTDVGYRLAPILYRIPDATCATERSVSDGWVDWSGLATLMSAAGRSLKGGVGRLLNEPDPSDRGFDSFYGTP